MSLSGGDKATLTSLDDGKFFEVQYNPKEFQVTKALTWQESEEQGQSRNSVQFQKGAHGHGRIVDGLDLEHQFGGARLCRSAGDPHAHRQQPRFGTGHLDHALGGDACRLDARYRQLVLAGEREPLHSNTVGVDGWSDVNPVLCAWY